MASGLQLVAVMAWRQDAYIRTGRQLRLLAVGLIFVQTLATGCSRQSSGLYLTLPPGASHDLPFNRGFEEGGISPTQALASSALPVGTLIAVRLASPLSSAGARSGDSFEAVLDEPILVQGQILVQRGAQVRGRVAAAKSSDPPNHAGYLRLTLSSIINNRDTLPVHTSSIFAKGSWRELSEVSSIKSVADRGAPDDGDAKFSTAQRLTFRLLGSLATGR